MGMKIFPGLKARKKPCAWLKRGKRVSIFSAILQRSHE
jgi:hypothetical protein